MGHSYSSRLPLQKLSNFNNNNSKSTSIERNKRRKISQKTTDMTSVIQHGIVKCNTKLKMDDLSKLRQDKENDLYNLNSEIWKIQTQIPDLELKIEKLKSKVSLMKSNFQALECQIKNLDVMKVEQLKSLENSLETFKNTLSRQFEKKVASWSQKYDDKITAIIKSKEDDFKKTEKSLSEQIKVLKNSLVDYSDKILTESKSKISQEIELELSDFVKSENEKIEEMKNDIKNLEDEIKQLNEEINKLNLKFDTETQPKLITIKSNLNKLDDELILTIQRESEFNLELNKLNSSKEEECAKLLALKEECRQFNQDIENFNSSIKEEEQYRRFLHNQLQEMKGNIRVFCRIKPDKSNTFKYKIQSMFETANIKESLTIIEPIQSSKSAKSSPVKKSDKSYTFSFDKIFDELSSNGDIFEEISQLVQSSLDGFNVCIFTYGQTGSGKTFTMSNSNDGLIPRSMDLMFEKINVLATLNKNYQLYGQFFEIYGDNIRDLIDDDFQPIENTKADLNIPISDIDDVKMIKLDSINQVELLLKHASTKRATASTMSNDVSSRSHSIFKVHVTTYNKTLEERVVLGILNLVDLAGSERLAHSQVKGMRLKETLAINKSLSALGDVIASLKSKSSHVPYRNSKLTYLLKDSLGGDSKTLMFVNISCLIKHFTETLSSLRFASKVNNTVLNKCHNTKP
jgi:kinesin family protein C1